MGGEGRTGRMLLLVRFAAAGRLCILLLFSEGVAMTKPENLDKCSTFMCSANMSEFGRTILHMSHLTEGSILEMETPRC